MRKVLFLEKVFSTDSRESIEDVTELKSNFESQINLQIRNGTTERFRTNLVADRPGQLLAGRSALIAADGLVSYTHRN